MKTKHIQYRLGLFIGLLSLNILSSCVNTRQGLGVNNTPDSHEEQPNIDDTFDQREEQRDQTTNRFNWVTTSVRSIATPLLRLRIQPEELLWGIQWIAIGYHLSDYILASTPGCTRELFPPYPGPGM